MSLITDHALSFKAYFVSSIMKRLEIRYMHLSCRMIYSNKNLKMYYNVHIFIIA